VWIGEHDAGLRRLRLDALRGVQTWGTPASDWYAQSLGVQADMQRLQLLHRGRDAGVFRTRWCGMHIVRSLAPVLGMAKVLGMADDVLTEALASSRPLPRRYEIVHAEAGLEIVDDNARLPDQVATTVASARARAGADGRVVAVLGVWGTLNRRDLASYATAVVGCDQVHVLPSAAFEQAQGGPEPDGADAKLVDLIRGKGVNARRLGTSADLPSFVSRRDGRTVVVTMGYESFVPVFRNIHGLLRFPVSADAALASV
jgi:UDP-N-acetylmuramate-alanine ligase